MNMEVICETGPPAYRPYPRRLEMSCSQTQAVITLIEKKEKIVHILRTGVQSLS